MTTRSTPWDSVHGVLRRATSEDLDLPGRSNELAALGAKVDLEASIEAADELSQVLRSLVARRPARLPSSLTLVQRSELYAFVTESLEGSHDATARDRIWSALEPGGQPAQDSPVSPEVAQQLLDQLDESHGALEFLERLRG
jgi:hypothetical protein